MALWTWHIQRNERTEEQKNEKIQLYNAQNVRIDTKKSNKQRLIADF